MSAPAMSDAAVALHRDALVVDSHNDSIVLHIRLGNRSFSDRPASPDAAPSSRSTHHGTIRYLRGPYPRSETPEPQVTLPKMRAGGLDAAFFSVDVTRARRNHVAYALDGHGFFIADVTAHSDEIVIARTAADVRAAKQSGKLAAVLTIENSDALDGSLNVLHAFHALGVRSIGLTHNPRAIAADGVGEAQASRLGPALPTESPRGGLSEFGVELVQEMNALGMLVDVSHISEQGFWDVIERSTQPVIASHSNCRALCDHVRGLTDDQLRAIAKNGGVVGISYVRSFLDPSTWQPRAATAPADQPSLVESILDHIEHVIRVAGPAHAGLGSDFDGGGTALRDATELPLLTQGLLDRGHSEATIRGVLGENLLRALAQAA
ncbi:MAG TPA: dipeptidase [Chloroflexota bacterium]|nr:dipeptidase [Chloroflexota bacterium]